MGIHRPGALIKRKLVGSQSQRRIPGDCGGRRVLHFKPAIWNQWQQELEVTSGEWLADQPVPLLQRRARLSREQAVELWRQRLAVGWKSCDPQWQPGRSRQLTDQPSSV